MPYSLTQGAPVITLDIEEFERQIATFCNANGLTTQAQWDAAVAGLTAGQQTQTVRAFLRSIRISPGTP